MTPLEQLKVRYNTYTCTCVILHLVFIIQTSMHTCKSLTILDQTVGCGLWGRIGECNYDKNTCTCISYMFTSNSVFNTRLLSMHVLVVYSIV